MADNDPLDQVTRTSNTHSTHFAVKRHWHLKICINIFQKVFYFLIRKLWFYKVHLLRNYTLSSQFHLLTIISILFTGSFDLIIPYLPLFYHLLISVLIQHIVICVILKTCSFWTINTVVCPSFKKVLKNDSLKQHLTLFQISKDLKQCEISFTNYLFQKWHVVCCKNGVFSKCCVLLKSHENQRLKYHFRPWWPLRHNYLKKLC